MTYTRCPLCHMTADRRIVEREDRDMNRLKSGVESFSGPGDGIPPGERDDGRETVECIQMIPCGHEFPREDIETLDGLAGRVADRQQELAALDGDFTDPEAELILQELSDLSDRLDDMKWRVQGAVVTEETRSIESVTGSSRYYGKSPIQTAYEQVESVNMTMENGSEMHWTGDRSSPDGEGASGDVEFLGSADSVEFEVTSGEVPDYTFDPETVEEARDMMGGSFEATMTVEEPLDDDVMDALYQGYLQEFSIATPSVDDVVEATIEGIEAGDLNEEDIDPHALFEELTEE